MAVSPVFIYLPIGSIVYTIQAPPSISQPHLREQYESTLKSGYRTLIRTLQVASNEYGNTIRSVWKGTDQSNAAKQTYLDAVESAYKDFINQTAKVSKKIEMLNASDIINLNEQFCKNIAETTLTGHIAAFQKTVLSCQKKLADKLAVAAQDFRDKTPTSASPSKRDAKAQRSIMQGARSTYLQNVIAAYDEFFASIRKIGTERMSSVRLLIQLYTDALAMPINTDDFRASMR